MWAEAWALPRVSLRADDDDALAGIQATWQFGS